MVSGMQREDKMDNSTNTWVFTFGFGQPLQGHFVRFSGTYAEARDKMIKNFGTEWAFQYSQEEWDEWVQNKPWYVPLETEIFVQEDDDEE